MIRQLITLSLALCASFAALGNEKPSQKETQVRQENFVLTLGERLFDPLAVEVVTQDKWNEISHGGTDLRLVQFDGPIQESWVESLVDSGLTPVQYIHPYTYITWADASSTEFALSLPHVRWTGDFLNGYRVLPKWRNLNDQPIDVKMIVYRGTDIQRTVEHLEELGVIRITHVPIDHRFEVFSFVAPGSLFLDISTLQGVYTIQPKPTDGGLRSEMSNQINAGNVDEQNMAYPGYEEWLEEIDLTGNGVIVAIVDGGSDQDHPDLSGQFVNCQGQSCGGSQSSSHGTHTAGTIGATGATGNTDSDGFLKGQGVAPGVSLVEQLYSPTYQQPGGMTQLMVESYQNGAVASSNSWGPSGSPQGYDIDTLEVDIGIRDADPNTPGNQQFSYVLAIMNGNGGTSTQGTPDEAKNIFTIGSTKMRTNGGTQYSAINDISSNSAHGPCLDGRTIPHMVAPGCRVLSTIPSGQSYSLMCGTSMACPQVAGGIALFVEQYREAFNENPSPALIKAAFAAAASDLSGNDDADGNTLGHPFDSKQGWGRMDLTSLLTNPTDSVRYYDAPVVLEQTGDQWSTTVSALDPSKPMRIMLVWTDAVGHGLGGSTPAWNNDLDLIVSSGMTLYRGNNFGSQGWSVSGGTADDKNNTEGVFLGPIPPGQVTITVRAANLNSDGIPNSGDGIDQDFSVVCYNASAEPGFSISMDPSSQSICAPASVEYSVQVGQIMGYSNPITLSFTPVLGMTASFSDNPVLPGNDVTLTVTVDDSVNDGTHTISVIGTSSDQSFHEASAVLDVSNILPQAVQLLQPTDGLTEVSISPVFQWQADSGVNAWHIQISTSPSVFDMIFEDSNIDSTPYQLPTILETNTPHFWRVSASNNCGIGDWSSWWTFRTTDAMTILLVDDDDNAPDVRSTYTALLENAGILYDIFDTENSDTEPDLSLLQGYPLVIWFTGDEYGGFSGPGSAGENALALYIEAGGHLLLSSQDYLYDNGLTSFGQNYLGIASYLSDVYQTAVVGADIFESVGSVTLNYPFSNWSDEINPSSDAFLTFEGNEGNAGIRKDGTHGGGAIFLAFPIEVMPTDSQGILLNEVVSWLGIDDIPCPADCDGDGFVDVLDLLAVIEGWGTSTGCDINNDGVIDIMDLLSVVASWGACP